MEGVFHLHLIPGRIINTLTTELVRNQNCGTYLIFDPKTKYLFSV